MLPINTVKVASMPTKEVQRVAPTIGVVSLGCPKNTSDTEVTLGMLQDAGNSISFHNDEADMDVEVALQYTEEYMVCWVISDRQ